MATRTPVGVDAPVTQADSGQGQQKVFDLMRRGREGKTHTASLLEPELNAFLRRNLVLSADLPLRNLTVRLQPDDRADITGQMLLRNLLTMPPFSAISAVMP